METVVTTNHVVPEPLMGEEQKELESLKILIAEDNAVSRRVLQSILLIYGVKVITASDGAEACRILQEDDPPQLVILDLEMPLLGGLEICQWIRSVPALKYTYVMLLTAKNSPDDLITGLQAGANDYITKPYNRAELWARIQVGRRVLELQKELAQGVCPHCGTSYQTKVGGWV
jgi:DNA-binding response OmpR family regulator